MENLALNHLGKIIHDYCGLNYLNNLSSLEVKISKRLADLNMKSYWSYIHFLENHPSEWEHLIELLTINETYFFREEKQLFVFQNMLKTKKTTMPVKIWSAGCSTGEEPYSLAMMILDTKLYGPNEIKIIGTDINQRAILTAKNGVYNKNSLSFRRIPENWLEKYFHETTTAYEITEPVKKFVTFHQLNLVGEIEKRIMEEYDIIFCRNVLIYFDEETIKNVVTSFYHALKKGGYLFLGHAETITHFDIGFETMNTDGTFYYRKV